MKKIIEVRFFRTINGYMPVRDWLLELSKEDRKQVGAELKTVELGWPLGMPLVRKIKAKLWEVRINLKNRIVRVIFALSGGKMVLLHGFIKKSQKTPPEDIELAAKRQRELEGSEK